MGKLSNLFHLLVLISLNFHVEGKAFDSSQPLVRSGQRSPPIPPKRDSFPFYVSAPVYELHDKLFRRIFDAILANGTFFNGVEARKATPFKFINPRKIASLVDFDMRTSGRSSDDELVGFVNKVLEFSPHVSHPFKVDRYGAGLDPYGIVGDWIGTSMTSIVITYFVAPVFTLMEYEVWQKTRLLIGYPEGKGDGMTVPGAGTGNGYATSVALNAKYPDFKMKGLVHCLQEDGKDGVVIFVSEHASFAYDKYAIWQGQGLDSVVKVKVDSQGRMDVVDLERKVMEAESNNKRGFMVVATVGTPILGAIDPIDKIAAVAEKHNLWLHVDGHVSGANFLSQTQSQRLRGIEKSDSFLWSPDRGLGAPFITTILVTRTENVIKKTFSHGSKLVFHDHPLYNRSIWDNGDGTLQCTRRPEIIKIWFMWKAKGQQNLEKHLDHTYKITEEATKELAKRNDAFTPILEKFDSPQVAFYYTPKPIRNRPKNVIQQVLNDARYTDKLKVKLLNEGKMTISVNSLPEVGTPFFVMTLTNSVLRKEEINYLLDQFEIYGEDEELLKHVKRSMEERGLSFDEPQENSKTNNRVLKFSPPAPAESYPDFVSAPIESLHLQFLQDFLNFVLQNSTYYQNLRDTNVQNFLTPEELLQKFDFSLSTNSTGVGNMREQGAELLRIMSEIIRYSAQTGHVYYNYQMTPASDPYSLMADFVTTVANSQMVRFEDNPMFTRMEFDVIRALRGILGYRGTMDNFGSGTIVPGGSAAIQIAELLATEKKVKDFKKVGLTQFNRTLVAFISEAAHYATEKGAIFGGIGMGNVVAVKTDSKGRMSIPFLRGAVDKAVAAGQIPFFVVATAGTTAIGAFDPIDRIADVAEEFGMWLHIDGSYGGTTLFSRNTTLVQARFKGLDRAHSFNMNPHKALSSVRESAVLVTRKIGVLNKVIPPPSQQDFNNEELYNGTVFDSGIYSLFTDRRPSMFKGWFMWKAKGIEGFSGHIDAGYNLTQQVIEELEKDSRQEMFQLHPTLPPESAQVNIFYIPKKYRSMDRNSDEFWDTIGHVQKRVARVLIKNHSLNLESKSDKRYPASLIMPLYYSYLNIDDVKYMLDVIDYYCEDIDLDS